MRLGPGDMGVLRTELVRVRPAIVGAREQLDATLDVDRARVHFDRRRTAALTAYGRLLEFMSADGRQKLREHVAFRKAHTKLVAFETPATPGADSTAID